MSRAILVVGATGNYGQPVTWQLGKDGFNVRVLTRSRDKAKKFFGEAFEIFEGNLDDDDSLRRALAGCWGVHINLRGWWKVKSHDRIEHRGTANVLRLAKEAGVERVTYLSTLNAREEYSFMPHLKAKVDAEKAVRASGIPFVVLAPSFFMENVHHLEKGSPIRVPKLTRSFHYVAADDYARIVSAAFQTPEAPSKRFDIYGPEAINAHEATKIFCSIVRPDTKIITLPRWLVSLYMHLTGHKNRQYAMRVMKFHQRVGEFGDPAAADLSLGRASTRFLDWCEAQRPATAQ